MVLLAMLVVAASVAAPDYSERERGRGGKGLGKADYVLHECDEKWFDDWRAVLTPSLAAGSWPLQSDCHRDRGNTPT